MVSHNLSSILGVVCTLVFSVVAGALLLQAMFDSKQTQAPIANNFMKKFENMKYKNIDFLLT